MEPNQRIGKNRMSRQLRIEYPGAFYHVTTRGNQKQPIILCDRDRSVIIGYIKEAMAKFNAKTHVYCLMQNHYHLLLETLLGNLSKILHFINTSYSVYFNKKHARTGHLFQGRYKAILIEKDTYALELSRYIHLNPVRAGIVAFPEEYPWSSYREYMGIRTTESWLNTAYMLGYFGQDLGIARSRYADFVVEAIGQKAENPLKKAGRSLILGSEDFIARIKKEFLVDTPENREVPAIRSLKEKPPLDIIHRTVEQSLGRKNRYARNAAIFLCRKRTDYTLADVAGFYGISKSAVAKIVGQMKEMLAWNKTIEDVLRETEESLFG